ncbi:hypothetical protein GRF29_106g464372 [Pseudopithomyces chartarum]|uniref:ABM domain-containing protein n=1 Tax=Pseudopithomyces chartarum TaxID=1892770 RepID=A0AAN6LVY7_9PLEO|nr:hypothetical protein GRF29_106g464372 [Pseudopithomyces chartarum]
MAANSLPTPSSSQHASTGVTEFSRLKIKDGINEQEIAALEHGLARAKKGMENFTGQKFYIFKEIENLNHIYILGGWASLEQHMDEWIPSEENQDLLKELGPFVKVDLFFHLDGHIGEIPPNTPAPILSCGRHVMESSQRPGFENTFEKRRGCLEAHTLGPAGAGWRIEKQADREELVLFCPWKDVSQHVAFGKTKDFQDYSEIRNHIVLSATEIVHLSLMELPI